jgi:hypothetical protein
MSEQTSERFTLSQRLAIVAVSLYLIAVGAILIARRLITVPSIWKVLKARMRAPYSGGIESVISETGHCYVAPVPGELLSDKESISRLVLYEDGKALGPRHAAHADIRGIGLGRFSHWGDALYFSTSDNTDPRSSGRRYTVREEIGGER